MDLAFPIARRKTQAFTKYRRAKASVDSIPYTLSKVSGSQVNHENRPTVDIYRKFRRRTELSRPNDLVTYCNNRPVLPFPEGYTVFLEKFFYLFQAGVPLPPVPISRPPVPKHERTANSFSIQSIQTTIIYAVITNQFQFDGAGRRRNGIPARRGDAKLPVPALPRGHITRFCDTKPIERPKDL